MRRLTVAQQKRALATRDKLLAAAVELFGADGYGSRSFRRHPRPAELPLSPKESPPKESIAVAIMNATDVEAEKHLGHTSQRPRRETFTECDSATAI